MPVAAGYQSPPPSPKTAQMAITGNVASGGQTHQVNMERPSTQAAPNLVYGTVCRVNFWVKMTTALGMTQIVVGLGCIVFYSVAFLTHGIVGYLGKYVPIGVAAGIIILFSGLVGSFASRKKNKYMIVSFIVLSVLSGLSAMFPMAMGIVGATNTALEHDSLLLPICQLVFATVELVVAAWSVGVCSQALCCPDATFGQVATRLHGGVGLTQFISTGDGQHVVLFTASQHQPDVYRIPNSNTPYIIQQGVPAVTVPTTAGQGTNFCVPITTSHGGQPGTNGLVTEGQPEVDQPEEQSRLLPSGSVDGGQGMRDDMYDAEDESTQLLC